MGSQWISKQRHGEKERGRNKAFSRKGMELKSAQQTTSSKARIEKSESKERKERKERALHAESEAIQSNYQKLGRIKSPRRHLGAVYLYTFRMPPSKIREPRAINRPCSPCRLDPSQGPAARSVSFPFISHLGLLSPDGAQPQVSFGQPQQQTAPSPQARTAPNWAVDEERPTRTVSAPPSSQPSRNQFETTQGGCCFRCFGIQRSV